MTLKNSQVRDFIDGRAPAKLIDGKDVLKPSRHFSMTLKNLQVRDFIDGRAPAKLIDCKDDYVHLVKRFSF